MESEFDCARTSEDENVRITVMKIRNACMRRPPLLVNHSIMTTHSLVIVVRTKHEAQRYGCKNGHRGCDNIATTRGWWERKRMTIQSSGSPARPGEPYGSWTATR